MGHSFDTRVKKDHCHIQTSQLWWGTTSCPKIPLSAQPNWGTRTISLGRRLSSVPIKSTRGDVFCWSKPWKPLIYCLKKSLRSLLCWSSPTRPSDPVHMALVRSSFLFSLHMSHIFSLPSLSLSVFNFFLSLFCCLNQSGVLSFLLFTLPLIKTL
jgi:hypothetical protein